MIDRYDLTSETRHFYEDSYEVHFMKKNPKGDFVKFKDYEAQFVLMQRALIEIQHSPDDRCSEIAADTLHAIRKLNNDSTR